MPALRALVVDGTSRKAVSVVRSLGRAGWRVTFASEAGLHPARGSRYCARSLRCPSAERQPEAFWAWLRDVLAREPADVLLPLEAAPIAAISPRRAELPSRCAFPFAADPVLRRAADKHAVVAAARAIGIAVPRSCLPAGPAELDHAAAEVGFPALIKPAVGQGSHGVRRVDDIAALREWHPRIVERFGPALVQEFIPYGGEFGVSVLMGNGSELLARFTHRRLRSYPVSGGPSTLREGASEPRIEADAERLLRALDWSGAAMVEFRRDARDGRFVLMEINHRFWGSLQLGIVSGVDFPVLLCRWAIGERFEPVLRYRIGVRCRWLFPGDLMHFLANPDRFRLEPSFFEFFGRDLHDDIGSWSDPLPLLLSIAETTGKALRPESWRRAVSRERH